MSKDAMEAGLEADGPKTVKVGDRVRINHNAPKVFNNEAGVIADIKRQGKASIYLSGFAAEFFFGPEEFDLVEGGAA